MESVSVLDVGAGPATMVGHRVAGKALTVVAVDPLAGAYDRLLRKARVSAPVRTEPVEGERLVERFGRDAFDIAFARNALDHAVEPAAIIEQMCAVVRPGGYVVLRHVRDEGVRQGYVQLHQWNFDERDGNLVMWRPGRMTNLTEALADRAVVECWREPTEDDDEAEWIVASIRKPDASSR